MKIPVTVVVMGGGPVDISAAKSSPHVGAIMWCGYPGQSGGASIADVVMGKINPAGKLTLTWYPESFTKQVPITDYGMRPNTKTGNPGRTYRFFTGEPVFKFGEGLSYTQFDAVLKAPTKVSTKYFDDDLTLHALSKKVATTVSVTSRNTGERAGDNVVLVFASPPGAGENGRPLRSLVAFDRVSLAPGEEKKSLLTIDAQHLTLATGLSQRETVPGPWKLWVGADGEDNAVTMTVVA
jgi:beta-D-xylosidase 4